MVAPIIPTNIYETPNEAGVPAETIRRVEIEKLTEKKETIETLTEPELPETDKGTSPTITEIHTPTSTKSPGIVDKSKGKAKTHIIDNPGDDATSFGDKNEELFIKEVDSAHEHK